MASTFSHFLYKNILLVSVLTDPWACQDKPLRIVKNKCNNNVHHNEIRVRDMVITFDTYR